MKIEKIKTIKRIGIEETSDLIVEKNHNFIANDILVHNCMEGIAEEFHKRGYVVIAIADPKRKWELAFQMFEPRESWHLAHLKKIGKVPEKKKVKLYHPFTFSIPSGYLPEVDFFTLSLKQFTGKEWNFIAETESEIETIKILKQTTKNISREDGIYSFLHQIENSIVGKSDGGRKKRDPNNFFLRVGSGRSTSLSDISNYLQPFKTDYFLAKDSCDTNLDIRKLLEDKENYHIFSGKWIKDEKVRDFMTLALIEAIINEVSIRPVKHPILFLIPEINHLCSDVKAGYKLILNQFMNDKLGMFRGQGRGISTISDSQIWSDISAPVRDKATITFFGKVGGGTDLDRIKKSYSYQRPIVEELKSPENKNTFLRSDALELNPVVIWFSASAHAEPKDDFIERYKKEKKKLMKYDNLVLKMKSFLKEDRDKIKRIVEAEKKEEAKIRLQEKLKKESKSEDKSDSTKERILKKVDEAKDKIMKLCYEMRNDINLLDKEKKWRKIGIKLGLHHSTAKKYCEEYEEYLIDKKQEEDFPEIKGAEENLDPEVKSNYNEVKKEIYESSELPED